MPICANGWAFYYSSVLIDVNAFDEKCKIKKVVQNRLTNALAAGII